MSEERLFTSGPNPHLNACVGTNGVPGDYAYVLGFAQAAMALLQTAINPPNFDARAALDGELVGDDDIGAHMDALVYPICFSARHHVELFLKRQIKRLVQVRNRKVDEAVLREHKLLPLLEELEKLCDATDPTLRQYLDPLVSPIRELHEFDEEGQTFRYRVSKQDELHRYGWGEATAGAWELRLA